MCLGRRLRRYCLLSPVFQGELPFTLHRFLLATGRGMPGEVQGQQLQEMLTRVSKPHCWGKAPLQPHLCSSQSQNKHPKALSDSTGCSTAAPGAVALRGRWVLCRAPARVGCPRLGAGPHLRRASRRAGGCKGRSWWQCWTHSWLQRAAPAPEKC